MVKYKKREDGRYLRQIQVGFYDNGKPKYKAIYGKTIKELEDRVAEFQQNQKRGMIVNDEGLTVGRWAEQWLESYKANNEYNTIRMYKGILSAHIIPSIGGIPLKKLKLFHIQDMINKQLADGHHRTAQQTLLTVKQILKTAVKNELIYKNAAEDVEIPKKAKPKKRALTDQEIGYIYAASLDLKQRAFLLTLLCTGMRKGEILALTKNDIDLKERAISVNKDAIIKVNQMEIKDRPKSEAGNRVIPIVDALYPILLEYMKQQDSMIVFPAAGGGLMSDTSYRFFWDRILKALNVAAGGSNGKLKVMALAPDITAHLFRHTFITLMYYSGVRLKTAQYLAGHSSIQMTMDVYTALDMKRDTASLPALNSYLNSINDKVGFEGNDENGRAGLHHNSGVCQPHQYQHQEGV
ncbi:MAG: site-specific integrase [Clostridiales bacterium]|jgi:integrase|nr:site-specific integrase [Clostridiales bacterium]